MSSNRIWFLSMQPCWYSGNVLKLWFYVILKPCGFCFKSNRNILDGWFLITVKGWLETVSVLRCPTEHTDACEQKQHLSMNIMWFPVSMAIQSIRIQQIISYDFHSDCIWLFPNLINDGYNTPTGFQTGPALGCCDWCIAYFSSYDLWLLHEAIAWVVLISYK